MMDYATRYKCRYCNLHRWLPERPLNPTPRVRAGCERCGSITPHNPVGTLHASPAARPLARGGSVLPHHGRTGGAVSSTFTRAGETTTDLVAQAEIEVTRSDGSDPVTHTVTDDVTLRLTDDGQLVAEIGGTGEVSIQTDA